MICDHQRRSLMLCAVILVIGYSYILNNGIIHVPVTMYMASDTRYQEARRMNISEKNHMRESDHFLSQETRGQWTDLLKCQEKRLKRLKRHCSDQDLNPSSLESIPASELKRLVNRFVLDDNHNVTLKSIPKTGCSSWKTMLIQNYSQKKPKNENDIYPHKWSIMTEKYGLKVLNTMSREDIITYLRHSFSILTVRHPLSRLESGFRDKILKKSNINLNNSQTVASTFQSFLDDILNTNVKDLNIHWKPVTVHTNPCVIPFNFIAKTETALMDMEYILKEQLTSFSEPVHVHKYTQTAAYARPERQQDGGKELPLFNLLKKPEGTIKKLMAKYQRDMDLFGYDYKSEQGNIIALCDGYKEFNFCC